MEDKKRSNEGECDGRKARLVDGTAGCQVARSKVEM